LRQLLVVGPDVDWAQATELAKEADDILFLSLEGALALEGSLGYRGEVLDISNEAEEIELLAWFWASNLVSHLQRHAWWLSSDVLGAARRRLFWDVFVPVAAARTRIAHVKTRLVEGYTLLHIGVSGLDSVELSELDMLLPTSMAKTGEVWELQDDAEPENTAPIGFRLLRLLAATARTLVREQNERRRVARERSTLRTLRDSLPGEPTVLVLLSFDVHFRLLRSTLSELASRGWRIIAADMNPRFAVAQSVHAVGGGDFEFFRLMPSTCTDSLRSLVLRRIGLASRQTRLVRGWAESVGLAPHVAFLSRSLDEHYEDARRLLSGHREVFRALRPEVILACSEIMRQVETAALEGKKWGIPMVNVQHGALANMTRFREFPYDAFCVWGQAYREALEANGTPSHRVRITGSPYLDAYQLDRNNAASVRLLDTAVSSFADPSCFRVLFAAGYVTNLVSDAILYESLDTVLKYADNDSSCRVVVKLHPTVVTAQLGYETAIANHPAASVVVTRDADLAELLNSCDCVATFGSTVGVDAALMAKPVILVRPRGISRAPALVTEGVALVATSSEEFKDVALRIREGSSVSDETLQRFRERYAFSGEGRASERIARVCEELVQS
jgi:hypothetical protein